MLTTGRRMRRVRRRDRRVVQGLTLVEVLSVMVILAILSAVAAPAMTEMLVRYRIEGLRTELVQSIQHARAEAVVRGYTVTLKRTTGCATPLLDNKDWSCGWVAFVDLDADGEEEAVDIRLQAISLPPGIQLKKASSPDGTQQFNQFGQSVGVGQRFELTSVDTRHASMAGSLCFSTGTRLRYKQGTGTC